MSDLIVPTGVALLVCERVIVDQRTRQRSLINIISRIGALRFPAVHPSLGVYLALSGGRGKLACEFRFVEFGQTKPKGVIPLTLDIKEPPELFEMDMMLPGVTLERAGRYQVQFWANGQFIIDRAFNVDLVQQKGGAAGAGAGDASVAALPSLPGQSGPATPADPTSPPPLDDDRIIRFTPPT